MAKLTPEMTTQEIMIEMSEGNPGALVVLAEIVKRTIKIDPDLMFGWLTPVLTMDEFGIRGPMIWMLYKDVCKQDLVAMLAVLRAYQMSLAGVTREKIMHAVDSYGDGLDVPSVVAAVKAKLPRFGGEMTGQVAAGL